jgi:hypothetical protein
LGVADFFHHARSKVNSGVSESEQTSFLAGAYHVRESKRTAVRAAVQLQPNASLQFGEHFTFTEETINETKH